MSQSHAPAGSTSVTPYLIVEEVETLLDFLGATFDAREILRMPGPDGRVQHAEVRIGDARLMMGRQPEGEPPFRASLYVYVEDCDASYARALEAGATAHHEPADQFHGDRSGSVYGPCGTHFALATRKEKLSPEQPRERHAGRRGMSSALSTRQVALGLGLWLGLAIVAGVLGVPARLEPPLPQVLLATLSVALIAAGFLIPAFRAWVFSVDERLLVGLHVSRLVGAWFLVLYQRGELPWAFAVPGGIGDIAVAVLALLLIATLRSRDRRGRAAYLAWNALGFLDILLVVLTAARLGVEEPSSMAALFRFPLCLVPTWLVPMIIASHVFLFARLARSEA